MSDAPARPRSPAVARAGRWPARGAALAVVAAFGAAAGPLGLLAGLATAAVWYALGTPYALAAGHVALVALTPDGAGPLAVGLVEAGLLALVAVPLWAGAARGRTLAVAGGALAGLGGLAWLAVRALPLWAAALATLGALAAASYALHRLELVTLGLVDDADAPPATGTSPTTSDDP